MSLPKRLLIVFCIAIAPYLQAQEKPASNFSDRAAISLRLQQTQIELQQHASDANPLTHDLLKRLETTIYHHQAAVDFLSLKENQSEQAAEAMRSWKGFDTPGPWSIRFSDELRMQLISLQHLQSAAEARLSIIAKVILDTVDQLSAYQRIERQLTETADSTDSSQQTLGSLQQNDIRSRTRVEKVTYLELRQRGVQAEFAAFKAGQELLKLQLESIAGQVIFSKSELDDILGRIADERNRALTILDADNGNEQVTDARIAWLAEFLDTEEIFWNTRYTALSTENLTQRNNALNTFSRMGQTIDIWAKVGKTLIVEQLINTGELSEEQVISAETQRLNRFKNHIDFAVSELEGTAILSISLLDRALDTVLAIWGTELYLVEDTTSFEGKRVTSYRAITLGKLIQLAFIMTIGWLTLRFLSRLVRRLASLRAGSSPQTAKLIARWTFGAGLTLLIIYALKWVHIPFTAFAFLGGTLAIGIGFGAQTIIKNFISGIILVLERPFKVGDFIEVDNVAGQIRHIGLRSSIIEHVDGIETIIPNSALLDNRVDNWTFGKTAIRGTVNVGVAYGSSTREVSRTLLATALEHGQVLDRPEPEVRFEKFGDSSLVFQLLFWVDATKIQRARLASDLRFMMEKALNEAGITIAYPQRNIHFDSTRPLQVEVSSSSGPIKPACTDKSS